MKCPVRDILRVRVILPSHTVIQSEAKNLGNTKKGKHQEGRKVDATEILHYTSFRSE